MAEFNFTIQTLDRLPNALVMTCHDEIVAVNQAALTFLAVRGLTNVVGRPFSSLFDPVSRTQLLTHWHNLAAKSDGVPWQLVGDDKATTPISLTALTTKEYGGTVALWQLDPRDAENIPADGGEIALLREQLEVTTSRLRHAEELIFKMAQNDALTGLPNRSLFQERLEASLANAQRLNRLTSVLFLDLDNFKDINDRLGHEVGDELLQQVAERLLQQTRKTDTVARLGGDEFAIIATHIQTTDATNVLAEKLVRALKGAFYIRNHKIHTGTSIGIATYPKDGTQATALLNCAEIAMYQAKSIGRDTHQHFHESLNRKAAKRWQTVEELRRAIECNELVNFYQPQIDITTGTIIGAEALIRWQHPEQGLIPPGDFIPFSEHSGLIAPITEQVLIHACRQAKRWAVHYPDFKVGVNLSATSFKRPGIVEMVRETLDAIGVAPKHLEIEITESMVMEDFDKANKTLGQLSDLGVSLAIDDFGTGYSSLAYLKRFPVNKLKIDRSFISDVVTNQDDASIACAIINMANSLGLRVIAEGIETTEQLDFLREHHCTEGQGYFFSRPVPAADLDQWLATWKMDPPAEHADGVAQSA